MNLIAYAFPELQTVKEVVRQTSKKPRFKTPFDSHYAKVFQTLLKSAAQHFYHIFFITLRKTEFRSVSHIDI